MTEDEELPAIFPLEGTPPRDFECTRVEQNDFLHERAWSEQAEGFSVTHLAQLHGIVVGYMTLAMDAIPLQTSEKPRSDLRLVRFPAMKIVQLAVDARWEGRGFGQHLVASAAVIAHRLSHTIGCRYLTVDAKPEVVDWYKHREFKINKVDRKALAERAEKAGKDPKLLPLSMRIDLFSLWEDLRDRFPLDFRRE